MKPKASTKRLLGHDTARPGFNLTTILIRGNGFILGLLLIHNKSLVLILIFEQIYVHIMRWNMTMISVGEQAPLFTMTNQDGNPVSLNNYTGKFVLMWWYPKADTPG